MKIPTAQFVGGVCTGLVFLSIYVVESADDKISLQPYLPLASGEQLLNSDKRFQQIMQGSGTSGGSISDVNWPQPKPKAEKIDVKAEIAKLNSSYIYQSSWPKASVKLGSVTAVSFDSAGNVVIFHRADRVWQQNTFDTANNFLHRKLGPISNNTVLAFSRRDGELVYEWGKNLFYMPHGLTIDHEDNVWVTDVALHQVFKFGPLGSGDKPLMTLGNAFVPGVGDKKFCKPTSVAVLENGDFFVADGYCNARIMKFSKDGEKILSWGQNSFSGFSHAVAPKNFFAIPHALTLVPEKELICAADRENGRVQCFYWSNCTFYSQYHSQIVGDRLFSIDYTPASGGQLIIVNGPTAELVSKPEHYNEVRGYIVDWKSQKVVSKFGPNDMQFQNPHDVAVTRDGNEIYVAELDPMRIHKFLHKNLAKSVPMSAAKHSTKSMANPEYEVEIDSGANSINNRTAHLSEEQEILHTQTHPRPGFTAILVAVLMLLFAFVTFGLAYHMARRHKRGCLLFGNKNRRHDWDFSAKPEGFKLSGLLMDRTKRSGFEKLDQNASDEEGETGGNTLSSAQFA